MDYSQVAYKQNAARTKYAKSRSIIKSVIDSLRVIKNFVVSADERNVTNNNNERNKLYLLILSNLAVVGRPKCSFKSWNCR